MSKPDDIPQDIWDEADEWSGWPLYADLTYADQVTIREGIARLILADRERSGGDPCVPDLLDALKRALNYLQATEGEFNIILDSAEACRAAIAKAERP